MRFMPLNLETGCLSTPQQEVLVPCSANGPGTWALGSLVRWVQNLKWIWPSATDVVMSFSTDKRILSLGLTILRAAKGCRWYTTPLDRKSAVWGKSGSVRVDLGGSRIIKIKKAKIILKN